MKTRLAALAFLLLAAPLQAAPPEDLPTEEVPADWQALVRLEVVTKDVPAPLYLTSPSGDDRLFIVSKRGKIYIFKDGAVDKTKPFLDFTKKVSNGYEQGLLGLAFHPKYKDNGLFYIHYADKKGFTRVSELKVSASNPDEADAGSEREILLLDGQAFPGHNAALPTFGPDGKLYIATGDGGFGNKPNTGQNPKDFYGKLVRVDVDTPGAKPETVGFGLRNPWRYSFDRFQGDLYIADVGHGKYEELNVVPIYNLHGHNFGWSIVEGKEHCFHKKTCDQSKMTQPIFEYTHKIGCSITGGYVYRGKLLPELAGNYFYADFCTGALRSMKVTEGAISEHYDWKPVLDPDDQFAALVSFGEDKDGELYLISLDGVIYKFTRATP